jgi:hypothetical protein
MQLEMSGSIIGKYIIRRCRIEYTVQIRDKYEVINEQLQ